MTVIEQRAYEAIISMAKKNEPDYWEKLKHQYAGMAMQGLCMNDFCECVGADDIATDAVAIAHALVEKLKELEERK